MSKNTSWDTSHQWYNEIVQKQGHYYHQKIIIPNILRLFEFDKISAPSLLDLACGQGVLARAIPHNVLYYGIDISSSLIASAKSLTNHPKATFLVGDISKKLPFKETLFTHASIVLAMQNIASPEDALKQASFHLVNEGSLILVLNHPYFRIPRQTHWGIDASQKIQYRRIDRYLSPLEIPIQTHPGKKNHTQETWSFHYPLSTYSQWLLNTGFMIQTIEEWVSDKKSIGKHAKMEDKARLEFPLFLTIKARKIAPKF